APPGAMWLALLPPALLLPRFLARRRAALALGLLFAAWAGLALALAPAPDYQSFLLDLLVRGTGLALVAIYSMTRIQKQPTLPPADDRTAILRRMTRACERLRGATSRQEIAEELASAAKASGPFGAASVSRVNWAKGLVQLEVALGGSGHTLGATEGLELPWADFAPLLGDDQRVSDHAYLAAQLPFRSLTGEHHMVLPLRAAGGEINGLLTVSADDEAGRQRLADQAPLLELLAAQAAIMFEHSQLQLSLTKRVLAGNLEIGRSVEEANRARERAETLYYIVRALSKTLDPTQLLDQALLLIAQATQAERGGIMLVEPRTGRLVFGTNLERHITKSEAAALERGQGLAGWVVEQRQSAIIPNTAEDDRWLVRSDHDTRGRSALAVPLDHDSEILGVIILLHNSIDHFTADHQQFVQVISDQVATMLNNLRTHQTLAEEVQQVSRQLELREEEAGRGLSILRSIGDGVVVGDRMGRIRLMNPAAEKLLNIEAQEYLGQPLLSLPGASDADQQEVDPEAFQQFEVNNRTIRAFASPIVTSGGEWLGSVVVYHDISASELADRLKTEFVATASHELRTPLTSIGGYIDLLLLNTLGPLTDQQRQFLGVVKNNIERLTAILNDLLDMSRIEAGQVRLQRREVKLDEMLHDAALLFSQQFGSKQISLAIDVPADLPPVVADQERVRQVLINLISNAYKYTRDGGSVDVVVRNGGGELSVAVKDTGVGIADKDKEHIFTRFYRTENPLKEQAGGTGLGLSIAKSLVELHGGRIWFDSAVNEGTTFTFTLPISGAADWTPAAWLEGAV
ncbi:MAG TPA: ATP-binding protein, partial [Herpetosiphonaceae bacterium]